MRGLFPDGQHGVKRHSPGVNRDLLQLRAPRRDALRRKSGLFLVQFTRSEVKDFQLRAELVHEDGDELAPVGGVVFDVHGDLERFQIAEALQQHGEDFLRVARGERADGERVEHRPVNLERVDEEVRGLVVDAQVHGAGVDVLGADVGESEMSEQRFEDFGERTHRGQQQRVRVGRQLEPPGVEPPVHTQRAYYGAQRVVGKVAKEGGASQSHFTEGTSVGTREGE